MVTSTIQDVELSVIVVAMFALLLDVIYLIWAFIAYEKNEDSVLEQQLWLSLINIIIALLMFIVLVALMIRGKIKLRARSWFLLTFAFLLVATVGGLISWALNQYYRKGSDIKESIIVAFSVALVIIILLGFLAKSLLSPAKPKSASAHETTHKAAVTEVVTAEATQETEEESSREEAITKKETTPTAE